VKGRKQQFTVGEVSLTLARPGFLEMAGLETDLRDILENSLTSEFSDTIPRILELAAADETEQDKAALASLADVGDVLALWDAWLEFAEVRNFLFKRELTRLEHIKRSRIAEYVAMGLSEEAARERIESVMTGSLSFTSGSPDTTGTYPPS
jgi:hypothetical protein